MFLARRQRLLCVLLILLQLLPVVSALAVLPADRADGVVSGCCETGESRSSCDLDGRHTCPEDRAHSPYPCPGTGCGLSGPIPQLVRQAPNSRATFPLAASPDYPDPSPRPAEKPPRQT
ncbi:MAG: hypothetical protein R3202_04175 [Candidatus Competibacterales bacterium]|nr:hypothetical protein [Candidatus Competibacterales bacterium]